MTRPHGAFLAILGLFIAALGCEPPSQHDPTRYGEVRVYVDPAWLGIDQVQIEQELENLNTLGPQFVRAGAGERRTARVVVQPYATARGCQVEAARWIVGTRIVEVDRTCKVSESSFRQAIGHEIGHALGMNHICEHPSDSDTMECSPVGYGDAMMGPRIRQSDEGPGWGEVYSGTLGFDEPTVLDLAEFRRVYSVIEGLPLVDGGAPQDGGVR